MKRAQITGFMLLGIIIVAVVGVTLFVGQSFAKKRIKDRISSMTSEILQTTTLEYYISLCVEQAVNEALIQIGDQGGMIYEDQAQGLPKYGVDLSEYYGPDYNPYYKNFLSLGPEERINYGVFQVDVNPNEKYGFYPAGYAISKLDNQVEKFGKNLFPKICDRFGPNRPETNIGSQCQQKSYSYRKTQPTVQGMLGDYVANLTQKCLNFDQIKNKFNYEIVEQEPPSATVTYGEKDVTFNVSYPLTFSFQDSAPLTKFLNFRTKKHVRLKRLLELSNAIVEQEIRDLSFNISSDYSKLKTLMDQQLTDPAINISRSTPCSTKCEPLSGQYDDVYTLTDFDSTLKGLPYTFRFAVKNRKPVLDLIATVTPDGMWSKQGFDMVVLEGETIEIIPKTIDPDEGDKIYYIYEGWKETTNETFIASKCNGEDMWSCIEIDNNTHPQEWMKGQDKLIDGRAKIKTGPKDIGPHNITIRTINEEDQSDWQVISIMVRPIPILKATTDNIYDDIKDHLAASVEDPYILDGSDTLFYLAQGHPRFNWHDSLEPFDIPYKTNTVPEIKESQKKDLIGKIKNLIFKVTKNTWPFFEQHDIIFSARDNSDTQFDEYIVEDVRVYQCLPHSSERDIYPYLYLDQSLDQKEYWFNFTGDHSCCQGDIDAQPVSERGRKILVYVVGAYDTNDIESFSKLKSYLIQKQYEPTFRDHEDFLRNGEDSFSLSELEGYDQLWVISMEGAIDKSSTSTYGELQRNHNQLIRSFVESNKGLAIFSGRPAVGENVYGLNLGDDYFSFSAVNQELVCEFDDVKYVSNTFGTPRVDQSGAIGVSSAIERVAHIDACGGSAAFFKIDNKPTKGGRVLFDTSYYKLLNENLDNREHKIYVENIANWLSKLSSVSITETSEVNWGAYSSNSKPCYGYDKYTCRPPLDNPDLKNEGDPALLAVKENNGEIVPYGPIQSDIDYEDDSNTINDLYQRKYEQKCSGTRGNVCSGVVTDKFVRVEICADKDEAAGEVESCQGPCLGCSKNDCPGTYQFEENPKCENYTSGTSFEKNFLHAGTGVCNPTLKQSSGDDFGNYVGKYGDNGGPFACQAACTNGECKYAINCVCDVQYGSDDECNGTTYQNVQYGTCMGTHGWCDNDCKYTSVEEQYTACLICAEGNFNKPDFEIIFSSSTQGNCCSNPTEFLRTYPDGKRACCSNPKQCSDKNGLCVSERTLDPDTGNYCAGGVWSKCIPGDIGTESSPGIDGCDTSPGYISFCTSRGFCSQIPI